MQQPALPLFDIPPVPAEGTVDDVGELLAYPGVTVDTRHDTEDSPAEAYINSRAAGKGRTSVAQRLRRAAQLMGYQDVAACPFERWRYAEMLRLRDKLAALVEADEYVPRTAREVLQNVKAVLRLAWSLGYIETVDELERTLAVPKIGGSYARNDPDTATDVDIARTLTLCELERHRRGIRDGFIIALGSVIGPRVSEYANLQLGDVSRDACTITIRKGKGRKNRTAYFSPTLLPYLDAYLAQRGTAPGPLLVRQTTNGKLWQGAIQRLSDQAVWAIITRCTEQAGRRLTPHALRRYAATRVTDITGNSALGSRLLGHTLKTTMDLYYHPHKDALKAASEQVEVIAPLRLGVIITPPPDETPVPPVEQRLLGVLLAMTETEGEAC